MAGTPRGMQFTDDFDSSSSVGVIALIFAAAHGWNSGRSSGVAFGSNVGIGAGSTPYRPLTPCAAPLGNQWPDRSGCPSESRGAGPPGGSGLIAYSVVCGFGAVCAPTATASAEQSAMPAIAAGVS